MIKAAQMEMFPPAMLPNDGSIRSWKLQPGGLNYFNARDPNSKPEFLKIQSNWPAMHEINEAHREIVRECFHLRLFQAITDLPENDRTKFEIQTRLREQVVMLAPFLGRMEREVFNPVLARVFGVMFRAGAFPPLPEVLAANPNVGAEIEYSGRLSLALKGLELTSGQETYNSLAPWAEVYPQMWDNFDPDEMARDTARGLGMPAEWIIRVDERDQMREAAAQQQQAQEALAAAAEVAPAYKDLSVAPEQGSPAEAIVGGAAQMLPGP